MRRVVPSLKLRLLGGLFLFLFVIFTLFYFLLLSSVRLQYTQSIEAKLSAAMKNLEYDKLFAKEQSYSFEHVKDEFGIETLFGQLALIEGESTKLVLKSRDLGENHLLIDKEILKELQTDTLIFTTLYDTHLSKNPLKVGYILVEQAGSKTLFLQCATPYAPTTQEIENIRHLLMIGLGILLLIILFLVNQIISRSLAETKNVVREVRGIKIDGKKHSIQKTGISKCIDELIETFNILIDQLQSSYKKTKEFGQNASHELKTPLTILRGEIEVGLRKERSTQEYKEILNSSLVEIDRLQDIIEKILFLSNSADLQIKEGFELIYIDEILDEVIEQKRPLAKRQNRELKLLKTQALTREGNPTLINLVIANLLDNAIKFSHEGGVVEIELLEDRLCIVDHGIGVKEEDLERIFDKFYRVNTHKEGSGLGLALVESIVHLHGFEIKFESVYKEGTRVEIIF
jgi:signal transduction histidine kinase